MGNSEEVEIINITVGLVEERCLIDLVQGSEHFALRFEDQMKALRFIQCLTAEGACVSQPHALVTLTCQIEARPSVAKESAVPSLAPAHLQFINEIQCVLWSRHPLPKKKKLMLSFLRSLLPAGSLKALGQLSPEILVARMKAELPDEPSQVTDVILSR